MIEAEGEPPRFEFEGEESFRLALAVAELADRVAMDLMERRPWAARQLGSASLSILNNTAEARGEYSRGDKARFYRYALRSAYETAAMVVLFATRGAVAPATERTLRGLLSDIMKVLTRRAVYFQRRSPSRPSTP